MAADRSPEELVAELGALRAELEGFLALAQNAETTDAQLAAAWARCEGGTPRIAEAGAAGAAAPAVRAALARELEALQRLNAFAAAAVSARHAAAAAELRDVRAAARRLEGYGRRREPGASCDLSG